MPSPHVMSVLGNPVVRSLCQFLPGGGSLDILITERLSEIQQERLDILVKKINQGQLKLDSKEVQSEKFIHAFVKTARAATNSYKREKIDLFAQVFIYGYNNHQFEEMDVYEEVLSIVEDMTLREFKILAALEKYSCTITKSINENDLLWTQKFWPNFVDAVEKELHINEAYLQAVLKRIERTGLYKEIVGTYLGYTGGKGTLTPLYTQVKSYLNIQIELGSQ